MRPHDLRRAVNAVVVFSGTVLLAASPFPGGCGSDVKQSKTYVDQSCDTMVNGQAPPGCGPSVGQECDTIVNGRPPPGCTERTGQTSPNCPDPGYPFDCGGGFCCPSGFPSCCGDSKWCGTTAAACEAVDDPGADGPSDSSGSGSNPSGGSSGPTGCGFDCAATGESSSQFREGCCVPSTGCVNSCGDGCGYGWYEAKGQLFGPCPGADGACLQNAAQNALKYCQ